MLDKSKDYLLQTGTFTSWYLAKTVEGTVPEDDVTAFKVAAIEVPYTTKNRSEKESERFLESERTVFHMWRDVLPYGFKPTAGSRVLALDVFWVVESVRFCDMDDSGFHQRYRLSCVKSKRQPVL
jgi:hypothetical protein